MPTFGLKPLDAILPVVLAEIAATAGSCREIEQRATKAVRDLVSPPLDLDIPPVPFPEHWL